MQQADHVLIPLLNHRSLVAQIARVEGSRALLLITFDQHLGGGSKPLHTSDIKAAVVTDLSSLAPGQWRTIGYNAIPRLPEVASWTLTGTDHFYDPAIIEAFCNAAMGLYPWDGFPDKDLFLNMMRPEWRQVPHRAKLASEFPQTDTG